MDEKLQIALIEMNRAVEDMKRSTRDIIEYLEEAAKKLTETINQK